MRELDGRCPAAWFARGRGALGGRVGVVKMRRREQRSARSDDPTGGSVLAKLLGRDSDCPPGSSSGARRGDGGCRGWFRELQSAEKAGPRWIEKRRYAPGRL